LAVTPAICNLLVPCSMKINTYSRRNSTVSTCKKSQARIRWACADRNASQDGPLRRGAGSIPAFFKISHTVEYAILWPNRASSPWIPTMPPPGVLPSHRHHQPPDRHLGRRPARSRRTRIGPSPGHQPAMPPQQRLRSDTEYLSPPTPRDQTSQRRHPYPVHGPIPHPFHVTAQHSVLVPKHQQFNVLGHLAAHNDRHHSEHEPRDHVDQRKKHPASVPASTTAPQQDLAGQQPRPYSRAAQADASVDHAPVPRGESAAAWTSQGGHDLAGVPGPAGPGHEWRPGLRPFRSRFSPKLI
jgi:hypothetical protein